MNTKLTNPSACELTKPFSPPESDAEDDFFCHRFSVPYPSIHCAYRTRYRTCPSCDNCDQGRFNLKRHRAQLNGLQLCSERRG